ncbi:MAG: polysaccharide biosynthesis protein, partial [archaeon]|jgi:FlaA1/EpsC-like NDP-sugar epimerase|nr:polysaccharide biosynthesis protein [archaeon]
MPLMNNGEIFVLKMSSCTISTLAESFLELYGYPAQQYEVIGTREGEKFHEELLFESEAGSLLENDQYFLRLPLQFKSPDLTPYEQQGFFRSQRASFISNDERYLLNKDQVKEILAKYLKKDE